MSINRPAVKRSRGELPHVGIPSPVRRRPARILIGLLTLCVGVAALLPAISSGASHGAHKLVFKIDGQARQDVVSAGGIVLTARCPAEACTVTASAAAKSPSVHTGRARVQVAAGGSSRMTLPLGAKDAGKLRAALEAGKKPTLTVKAMARDHYGAKVPLELTVTALRG
jgi:hypothetical protein